MMSSGILNDMHIDANLVITHLRAKDDQDALYQVASVLLKEGIVKESYIPAVKAREVEYSTGLQCEEMGVAIPHTDSEHVNIQAIGIGILEEPVRFKQMGAPDIEVEVRIMFMLAIKEPHKQMDFLQALMAIFMEQGKLPALLKCDTSEEVVKTFTSFFK